MGIACLRLQIRGTRIAILPSVPVVKVNAIGLMPAQMMRYLYIMKEWLNRGMQFEKLKKRTKNLHPD